MCVGLVVLCERSMYLAMMSFVCFMVCGNLAIALLRTAMRLNKRYAAGSKSFELEVQLKTRSTHLLADLGPIAFEMAALSC